MQFFKSNNLFTRQFEDFCQLEKDQNAAFLLLTSFSVLASANLIIVIIISPTVSELIMAILLAFFSISATLMHKTKHKKPKFLISPLIVFAQCLISLQFSETYLPRVNLEIFTAIELKVWVSLLLYFAERQFKWRAVAVICQLVIVAARDLGFKAPWIYLQSSLMILIFLIVDKDQKLILYESYQTSKQLKFFSYLINKVLPFGYMILGIDEKDRKNGVNLLGFNEFMRKIFELDEKDQNFNDKLLNIFRSNFLNRNRKTLSCLSIEEKRQKSILSYVIERLNQSNRKSQTSDDIMVLEEIYQQEVVYTDGKAKAMDIVILQANFYANPCVFLVVNDISDRVLNYKLTILDRFKDRFLQSISHNLKTPLNSITGLVSLMHNMVFNTEGLNYLNNIRINSDILLYEINNILDYANYRKNTLQATVSQFTVTSLLNDLFSLFELSLFEKKLKISKKIKLELEENLLCSDLARLKQVLFNLISNSVKFTFEGQIKVSVSKSRDLAIQTDLLKFSIRDSGIGISIEEQHKLFRLWGSMNDEIIDNPNETHMNSRSGAGLGLTITRHLIGILGPEEKVYFKSKTGKGSTFYFYIYQNLNAPNLFSAGNRRKVEVVPSYDSSDLSINKLPVNSQHMLNSFKKGDTMAYGNFSSYVTQNLGLRSPKRGSTNITNMRASININMRSSITKGLCMRKENTGHSPSNFSPKSPKKNSFPDKEQDVFDESDCIVNKVYNSNNMFYSLEKKGVGSEEVERSFPCFKLNLINVENRSTTKELVIGPTSPITPLPKRVLIVDDTPFNLLVLEKFIQDLDPKAQIFKAFNGKEALELFCQFKEPMKSGFDVIFMDCNMPVMDGYEASQEIKKVIREEKLNFTPILAITSYSGKQEELKCLKNGMDGYLGKPINKEIFGEFYSKWVFNKEME